MTDRPMTVKEAATFLSVNPWQILYYINQGQLRAYKMGNGTGKKGNRRHWRIWKEDILTFLHKSSNTIEGD